VLTCVNHYESWIDIIFVSIYINFCHHPCRTSPLRFFICDACRNFDQLGEITAETRLPIFRSVGVPRLSNGSGVFLMSCSCKIYFFFCNSTF
jgi:hypothetical protein